MRAPRAGGALGDEVVKVQHRVVGAGDRAALPLRAAAQVAEHRAVAPRDAGRHLLRDVVLHGEEIALAQVEGVALVPEHLPRRRVGEAGVDAHRLAQALDAAQHQVAGAELAADARQVGHLVAILQRRLAGDHCHAVEAGQREGELGGETLGEIGLFRIARQRLERQHRDHRRPGALGRAATRVRRHGRDLAAVRDGERRHVASLGHADAQRVARTRGRVIAVERAPQAPGLDAHQRIGVGVESGIAMKHLDGDPVTLEPRHTAGQRLVDQEAQHVAQSGRRRELVARQHAIELGADGVRRCRQGAGGGGIAALPRQMLAQWTPCMLRSPQIALGAARRARRRARSRHPGNRAAVRTLRCVTVFYVGSGSPNG